MAYRDYMQRIATRFRALFNEISANYNFDLGDEFEIAICMALDQMLPRKFAVCRGFVVTADDQIAGDDIIIYDRNFPTLRFLTHGDFSKKEEIPVEAVYAYVEAKHTLKFDQPSGTNGNVNKALRQVAAVKSLPRMPVESGQIDPYVAWPFVVPRQVGWPGTVNRMYGAVFARHVDVPPQDLLPCLQALQSVPPTEHFPDVIVAGEDMVFVPYVLNQRTSVPTVFPFLEHDNALGVFRVPGLAFSVGLCTLMYALDTMRLGRLQWFPILRDVLTPRPRA
jgi:hypothetical protein